MRNPAQAGRAMSDRGGGSRSGGGRAVRAGAYAGVRAGPLGEPGLCGCGPGRAVPGMSRAMRLGAVSTCGGAV